MKITSLWAAVALLRASAVLAQDQPSGTSTSPVSTTSAAPTCTASEITKLCDYKKPVIAAAIESRASCWEYCNEHQPCSFVVFAAGNPYTGSGTCWLYPGEDFDKSAGNTDCGNPYLTVYSKPECSGGTPTSGGCEATASPSAIATICGYPTPPDDCFYTCTASDGAVNCLSQCAKSDSCSYAVFNPRNEQNSPYLGGTCWMYPNGTYDAGLAGKCDGDPEQWVYNNVCPKPSPLSASSSQPSPSASATGGSGGSGGSGSAGAGQDITTTRSEGLAPTGFPIANPLAVGVAVLLWQGL